MKIKKKKKKKKKGVQMKKKWRGAEEQKIRGFPELPLKPLESTHHKNHDLQPSSHTHVHSRPSLSHLTTSQGTFFFPP